MNRTNVIRLITRTRLARFLPLIALVFSALPVIPSQAAPSTISDKASCEAHGGGWYSGPPCYYYYGSFLNIAAVMWFG
jgi:hypothetical protein